jgi:redox-sensitive bicupin YhaK (pirin superfamily)
MIVLGEDDDTISKESVMIKVRKSKERGVGAHGWLNSQHSFSFADYYDEAHMGFGPLRVINEDRIEGGKGFGSHPHRDMEIISYVMSGSLQHKDSMGNTAVIRPGEVQRMSAGSGIVHSEINNESDKQTHFLQIWIIPETRGGNPGYGQIDFSEAIEKGGLVLAISKTGRDGSIAIKQDADLYIARLKGDHELTAKPGRGFWVQVIKGELDVNGQQLAAGDAAAVQDEKLLKIKGDGAEILVFDLPLQ